MVSTTYAACGLGSGPGGRDVIVQVVRPGPRAGAVPGGGPLVGPSLGRSASSEHETLTPSRTSPAAALRLAAVIRLTVPAWSSFPHLPQLESSVIQRSTSSLVRSRGYFDSVAAVALD